MRSYDLVVSVRAAVQMEGAGESGRPPSRLSPRVTQAGAARCISRPRGQRLRRLRGGHRSRSGLCA